MAEDVPQVDRELLLDREARVEAVDGDGRRSTGIAPAPATGIARDLPRGPPGLAGPARSAGKSRGPR